MALYMWDFSSSTRYGTHCPCSGIPNYQPTLEVHEMILILRNANNSDYQNHLLSNTLFTLSYEKYKMV